jgi:uncharacterized membrane protein YidH (DUF202 family)
VDGPARLFSYVGKLGVISPGFATFNGVLTFAVAALVRPSRDDDDVVLLSVLTKDALTISAYAALVALATLTLVGVASDPTTTAGGVLLGATTIVTIVGGAMRRRRTRAATAGRSPRPRIADRMLVFEPVLLALGPVVFLACLLLPALALPSVLGPVLSTTSSLGTLPLVSWLTVLVAGGFAARAIVRGRSAGGLLAATGPGSVRAGRARGMSPTGSRRVGGALEVRGPRDDGRHLRQWFERVRTGSAVEMIEARSRLATVFEHRGLYSAATDLLISNVNDGVRDAETYTRLARLYRGRGQSILAALATKAARESRGTGPTGPPARTVERVAGRCD